MKGRKAWRSIGPAIPAALRPVYAEDFSRLVTFKTHRHRTKRGVARVLN